MNAPVTTPGATRPAGGCLTRAVASVLAEEPTLEAVTVDRAQQKISVATLGRTDVAQLTERVSAKIQEAASPEAVAACQLLRGAGDCSICDTPLNEQERRNITIRHEQDSTTIARVTCPTAPKFWRWRDLPFPKVRPTRRGVSGARRGT